MSSEFVLLLGIYGFIILGAFVGDKGPGATFKDAGPRLGARVERDLATGTRFNDKTTNSRITRWLDPGSGNGGN